MNRKTLIARTATVCGVSKTLAGRIIETALLQMAGALAEHEPVELRGFGRFKPFVDPGRVVRDPRHPEKGAYRMPPRIAVKFTAGDALLDAMNVSKPTATKTPRTG